jgi:hypothetical protein
MMFAIMDEALCIALVVRMTDRHAARGRVPNWRVWQRMDRWRPVLFGVRNR